jgi:two-component system, NtrC family, sensor kinase
MVLQSKTGKLKAREAVSKKGWEASGVKNVKTGTPRSRRLISDLTNKNARLLEETKEALEHQKVTSEVLQVIGRSMADTQPVFEQIIDSIERLFDCKQTAVFLAPGDDFLHLAARRGSGVEKIDHLYPQPIDQTSAAGMLRGQSYVPDARHAQDGSPVLRRVVEMIGNFSMVMTPMIWNEQSVGLIAVLRETNAVFDSKELDLLRTFADQAVIAIQNARLFKETKEALEHQTATADILKVIASSPSVVQPVFEAIAERSNRIVGGLTTAVFNLTEDVLSLTAFTRTNPVADSSLEALFPAPLSSFSFAETIRRGEIHHIADAGVDYITRPSIQDMARLRGWRSALYVPLLRDNKPIGMISVTRVEPGAFDPHHVRLLRTFADQAVIAVSNVGLFEELQQRTGELAASLDDLRAAKDRLVQTEKLASLGQLTAGIAHEIKNPLNFVNNFSMLSAELIDELNDLLNEADVNERVRAEVGVLSEFLKNNLMKVVQHGKRADSIVKNMLLHSRENTGDRLPTDINALVDESLNLAYHGARAGSPQFDVTFERNFDPAAGMIDLYPQEITRVFLNLISNGFYAVNKRREAAAADFEPRLSAATKNLGNKVEIRVRDNGTGIPRELKEKIFNPFFTTKPAGEGTGLGLSMSHDIIVKQHGGKIDVDTEPGAFTEFIITLPRNRAGKIPVGG